MTRHDYLLALDVAKRIGRREQTRARTFVVGRAAACDTGVCNINTRSKTVRHGSQTPFPPKFNADEPKHGSGSVCKINVRFHNIISALSFRGRRGEDNIMVLPSWTGVYFPNTRITARSRNPTTTDRNVARGASQAAHLSGRERPSCFSPVKSQPAK